MTIKTYVLAFIFVLQPLALFAQQAPEESKPSVVDQAKQGAQDFIDEAKKITEESKLRRAQTPYTILANYSSIDLLIPGKIGATFSLNSGSEFTHEVEYLRGKLEVPSFIADIGKYEDKRISYIRRSFADRNTFNWFWGVSYFQSKITLGDDILSRLSGGNYSAVEVLDIQSLGFNIGLGNRWQVEKNITIGVDWFVWSQPLFNIKKSTPFIDQATNQNDIDDAKKAINFANYLPRLTILKLQVGASF